MNNCYWSIESIIFFSQIATESTCLIVKVRLVKYEINNIRLPVYLVGIELLHKEK